MKELNEDSITDLSNINKVESDLKLLGLIGIDDLLAENVKKCITDFRRAGIKPWMLTGDKGETALSIARSCGIFDSEN